MGDYMVRGTSGDVSTCDCCGRTDLTRTVILWPTEGGIPSVDEVMYVGSYCAGLMLGTKAASVRRAASVADLETEREEAVARRILDRYADVEGLLPRDAVLRYAEGNIDSIRWRKLDYDEVLAELRDLVADARAVLGLPRPAAGDVTVIPAPAAPTAETAETEEADVPAETAPMFDTLPLFGQTTIEEQIADAETETETEAAPVPAPALPGDGTLFALRVTNTTTADGALFGLTV